jgi:chemotaxis family two-component system response regulator Rcp1
MIERRAENIISPRLGKPITILMAEDNPDDVELTMEALKKAKVRNKLYVVGDGVATMDFLHKRGEYKDAPRPNLILLDLNMPKKDGREVLADIKEDEDLRRIPVVVLTTSKNDQDVLEAYNHYANSYITKPVNLDRFLEVVQAIERFWLTIVELPPE